MGQRLAERPVGLTQHCETGTEPPAPIGVGTGMTVRVQLKRESTERRLQLAGVEVFCEGGAESAERCQRISLGRAQSADARPPGYPRIFSCRPQLPSARWRSGTGIQRAEGKDASRTEGFRPDRVRSGDGWFSRGLELGGEQGLEQVCSRHRPRNRPRIPDPQTRESAQRSGRYADYSGGYVASCGSVTAGVVRDVEARRIRGSWIWQPSSVSSSASVS